MKIILLPEWCKGNNYFFWIVLPEIKRSLIQLQAPFKITSPCNIKVDENNKSYASAQARADKQAVDTNNLTQAELTSNFLRTHGSTELLVQNCQAQVRVLSTKWKAKIKVQSLKSKVQRPEERDWDWGWHYNPTSHHSKSCKSFKKTVFWKKLFI